MDSERHSKRAAASREPLSDCMSVLLWKMDFAVVCEVSHCSSCDFLASNVLFSELVMEVAVNSMECSCW